MKQLTLQFYSDLRLFDLLARSSFHIRDMETAERPIILYWVMATVGLWWVANTIATIASKSVMKGDDISFKGTTGWTSAFEDLRWVDLTTYQHLMYVQS